jgi:hypothetical protein
LKKEKRKKEKSKREGEKEYCWREEGRGGM